MMHRTLFLTFVILHCSQALLVPLLTWTTSHNQEKVPAITAGQTKDLSKVYNDYLTPMIQNKSIVLLFIQDELSADDFTKYSTSFPHLQKILHNERYLLFPSVSKKEEALTQLISSSQGNIEHVDSGRLTGWKFELPSEVAPTKFVIFNLEPVSGSHSKGKGEILERNDLLMHRIVKSVHDKVKDICVVYTAEEPAPMITDILHNEDMADNGLASRHILEAATKAPTVAPQRAKFFNATAVMMHVRGIQLRHKKESTELLIPGVSWNVTKVYDSPCSINISTNTAIGKYSNVTIAMKFINNTHEWYCDQLLLSGEYDGKRFDKSFFCGRPLNGTTFTSVYDSIHAPSGKSYSCYKLTFAKPVSGEAGNYSDEVVFDGMQVQTMCDGKGSLAQFRTTYDCVGFFTIEALTAIFVTLILIIGLYVGVMMIMAIQVQDRLDDPKGKTITVITASHD